MNLDFGSLVAAIRHAHEHMAARAGRAINISLTLRNWVVGAHIREYEQNGSDRAQYGAQVLEHLARELQSSLDKCYTDRYLRLCRQIYETYPQIRKSLISKFGGPQNGKSSISEWPALPGTDAPAGAPAPPARPAVDGDALVERLSFTHIVEIMKIRDPLKRAFYETECMRGNWSVRELKRQIGSLYYERSGLSGNKEKLAALVRTGAQTADARLAVRDPYVFEFLGLRPREVMGESDLEDALLDRLQDFLLELGHGFCFEGRQRRILIGETCGFVDLVFYHRILKCHVPIELKVAEFSHEHVGQLNTYVSWYKRNMMGEGDGPPVGILLCTGKDHALVEYALADMDNRLFVSKYQLELPTREDMRRFLEAQLKEVSGGR